MPERIYKYHEHQTLLENREDEVLNDEERKAAWEEFENEKKARANPNSGSGGNEQYTVAQISHYFVSVKILLFNNVIF